MPTGVDSKAPVVLGVAAIGMVGVGLYFWQKKATGLSPDDTLIAQFKFDYSGGSNIYVIQVSLGNILVGGWFDHLEGMTWSRKVTLPASGSYEFDLECELPMAVALRTYDAEALIRTPESHWLRYLVKLVTKNAVRVR